MSEYDPLTGEIVRASRITPRRYEKDRPGELVHVDVKKIGRIPPGGGWRTWGREAKSDDSAHKLARTRYDFVHSMVDAHSRLVYSEVPPDENRVTCAGFLDGAGAWFAERGVAIEAVMTDNAFSYRHANAWREVMAILGARAVFIQPHCPWRNGKVCASTAPSRSSGPTTRSSPATRAERQPLVSGWRAITIHDPTVLSEDGCRSVDWHQRDGRIHLVA